MESDLFESLAHHLVEKGVLTRNDVLSVVQTVAEVRQGRVEAQGPLGAVAVTELVQLKKLYASFELMTDRPIGSQHFDGSNVRHLRPPVHGDRPTFPEDN